jgi:hypothetical protein
VLYSRLRLLTCFSVFRRWTLADAQSGAAEYEVRLVARMNKLAAAHPRHGVQRVKAPRKEAPIARHDTMSTVATEIPLRTVDGLLHRLFFGGADRRAHERTDFIAKYDDYVAVATLFANDLGSVKSVVSRSALGRSFDWLATKIDLLSSDAQDEAMSRILFPAEHKRHEAMLREFIRAQTRLGTIAPDAVRHEIKETSVLLVRWSQNQSEDLTEEWLEHRKQLQRAADAHLRPRWRRLRRRDT